MNELKMDPQNFGPTIESVLAHTEAELAELKAIKPFISPIYEARVVAVVSYFLICCDVNLGFDLVLRSRFFCLMTEPKRDMEAVLAREKLKKLLTNKTVHIQLVVDHSVAKESTIRLWKEGVLVR